MKEMISNDQYNYVKLIYKQNSQKIEEIKNSDLCYGDKARLIIKYNITDNLIYARKLLEIRPYFNKHSKNKKRSNYYDKKRR